MTPLLRHSRAFTLIEILVAVAIFAVLSTLAYGALGQIILSSEVLSERQQRILAIQKTMRTLSQDFLQLSPRPVRDELGDGFGAALRSDFQNAFAVELTRGGWNNPMSLPRGTLQRAAYRIEEDELIRYHWRVLDRTFNNELVAVSMLEDVESIVFLFMQENGEWTEQWPPQGRQGPQGLRLRPRAVQVVLNLVDEGEITRLIEVAP